MALRNQPYFPLYVNDFLSDEKLILCSAESTGVYIRVMCLMHKSEEYGVILLHQKFKQNVKPTFNFATQLAVFLPYTADVIERSLDDLIDNKVLTLDGDRMIQKRMVKDEKISQVRVISGSKGGKKSSETRSSILKNTANFPSNFPIAKDQANTEYVNESEYETVNTTRSKKKNVKFIPPTIEQIKEYITEKGYNVNPQTFFDHFTEGEPKWVDANGKPVLNWKQKIVTWNSFNKAKAPEEPKRRYLYTDENGKVQEGYR